MSRLECVEVQTREHANGTVIWLHGLGADGYDFVPLVRELESLGAPAVRYVFPHAPTRAVTINGGAVMRAWYDILGTDLARREDESGIRQSQHDVAALVARENERGIANARIVLAGFSQGGAIVLQTGLRITQPLAGLLALSTYLPLAQTLAAERAIASAGVPILMAHGRQDPVIPISRATASRDQLRGLGYSVQWHEYPMPHSVCADEVEEIAKFLEDRLG